ncbi:hypothetical protein N781_16530 [Pontibacillus halophilus JSM 076056 = DSM 19796]|uniref:Uncharacterized protein n=1 Tax=Pontibacillus halophilus JSM 076056 = DSM 19796 TaxID=1385510 RepID=A0A0A5GK20_9BACI|nr:hypothetical protein [Pontibacillus halophilus]KGX92359.1 hypothetical protein N781_16530 [Pontibacillus halophilus JSM 076056 = DSM 19796]
MPNEAMFLLCMCSIFLWVLVSREAVKPSKEVNWWRMVTFLSAGSLSALLITINLVQSLV